MKKIFVIFFLAVYVCACSVPHRGHHHTVIVDKGFGLIKKYKEVKDSNNVFNVTITFLNTGIEDIYLTTDILCSCKTKTRKILPGDSAVIIAKYDKFDKTGFDFEIYRFVYIGKKIHFIGGEVIGYYCEEEDRIFK